MDLFTQLLNSVNFLNDAYSETERQESICHLNLANNPCHFYQLLQSSTNNIQVLRQLNPPYAFFSREANISLSHITVDLQTLTIYRISAHKKILLEAQRHARLIDHWLSYEYELIYNTSPSADYQLSPLSEDFTRKIEPWRCPLNELKGKVYTDSDLSTIMQFIFGSSDVDPEKYYIAAILLTCQNLVDPCPTNAGYFPERVLEAPLAPRPT